jgi:methionine--tRNA ligase beta chain
MITFDDFQEIELKVAKITEAERVEKSEKLLKLQLSLGEEQRQIVAGIGKKYNPEDLVGKEIVIVANLEPKELFGIESHGMLLAASNEEELALLQPDKEITPGSKIG